MDNIKSIYVAGLRDGTNYLLDMVDFIKMSKHFDRINNPRSAGYSLGCAMKLLFWLEELGVDAKELKNIAKLAITR